MIDNTIRLKMLPVCEHCGHVFYDGISIYPHKYEFNTQGKIMPKAQISPSQCPSCGKTIEAIEYQDLDDYIVYND